MKAINIADFFLINIPEALVIFSSLSVIVEKEIRKKDIIYMALIYSVICFILKNNFPVGLNNIFMSISIAIIIYLYSKVNLARCCIATIITLSTILFFEMLSIVFISFIGINLESVLENQILKILVYYIPISVMFIVIRLLKYKKFIKKVDNSSKMYINKQIESMILYISALIMIIMGIVVLLVYNNKSLVYSTERFLILFLTFSFILILIGLILILINYNKRKVLDEVERNLIENNLKQMKDTVDVLRLQRHDYMNHLQVILLQISNGKNEDARNYILGISNDDSSGITYFSTGNSYIDAILNTKKRRALKYDIQLTACIDSLLEDIELSDSEISSILLNIIDNAIDELKKHNKDYKYIHIDVYKEEYYHNISIKNNGSIIKDKKKIFELGYSSKGINRGYGLYAIKKLLESYNCSIDVYSDDMETEFNIQVPITVNS
ncbi:GHKL domain-containing protein [Paeniclostridium sp. NSJ-45]|uniref:GHKL domain-containing protein n=1 Tax=Paeniclostridium hominis TaxID=2764329 RepID=A0ABR7K1Y0_9FIRM|nr:GHKL domain-containing protein [Paeniclostridium hominis]